MSKSRESMQFKWVKSSNDKILLLTIIIALGTFLQGFSNGMPHWITWTFAQLLVLSTILFGGTYIESFAHETLYWNVGLRDLRKNVSKYEKYSFYVKYVLNLIVGLTIVLFGLLLGAVLNGWIRNPLVSV
jgi:hypothetical protein